MRLQTLTDMPCFSNKCVKISFLGPKKLQEELKQGYPLRPSIFFLYFTSSTRRRQALVKLWNEEKNTFW